MSALQEALLLLGCVAGMVGALFLFLLLFIDNNIPPRRRNP